MVRDGRDVANSLIGMGWAGNMYTAADYWLHVEEEWDRLRRMVSPDRYIDVRYEELVKEPEATLERICEFLGLPYDSAMLDYPDDTTYAYPSPHTIGNWKKSLAPEAIRLGEARIGDKLIELGYSLSGLERMTIGPATEKALWRQDRWYRRTFRRRRYGSFLYFGHFLTRRFGPRKWRAWIDRRIGEIARRNLK